jgi:pyrroline-5-carboxylate reductase
VELIRHAGRLPRPADQHTPGTTVAAVTTGGRSGLAIVGGGKIGEALLAGLVRQSGSAGAGAGPGPLLIVERSPQRAAELVERYGVDAPDLATAAARARVLLLAVKPQDIDTLLTALAPHVTPEHLVVSVAAGVPTRRIEAALPARTPVVRVMPNTPALVDEGMSVLSAGAHATEAHLDEAESLLAPVGQVRRVPESQQDAVTALSGSGPAYFFFLVEAMIDAGILLGLPRTLAADLIVQTALGAAVMLRDSGEHPVQLREAVTSPGGTTIAAIRELERHGVRAALIAAIEAAHQRSVELGRTD